MWPRRRAAAPSRVAVQRRPAGEVLLGRPAIEIAAEHYVSEVTRDLTGRTVGRYEIVVKLGAGGMGEVYRARDTRLKREVALKVLPPKWIADAERKRRFEREARAASSLNHPNIVTIYDIDQVGGVSFIAMEYVAGKTLDQVIPKTGLPLHEALTYATGISGGLTAAHGAGIVHRDIKPSNLMVTTTGQLKVLDFGLAKLTEPNPAGVDAPTGSLNPETEEGAIVGTISYMSPEQAQGKPVDARSDIFSFGSVLYEMVTGRKAFQGDTKITTLAAIIEREPPALNGNLPVELQQLITRCLRKDPERRIQQMDDVRIAIQELKEEPGSGRSSVAPLRRHWTWVLTGLLAAGFAGAVWHGRDGGQISSPIEVTPLTSYPGEETYPNLSPDGNHVVFSWNGEKRDNTDIYVKQIGAPTPVPLTTNPADDLSPAFSPDGRSIGFVRSLATGYVFVTIPSIGGSERVVGDILSTDHFRDLIDQMPGPLFAWFPDGKHVVTAGLAVFSVETGESTELTSRPPNLLADSSPAVSPDGRTIAFGRSSGYGTSDVYLVDLTPDLRARGDPRRLTSQKGPNHSSFWTADGRRIIYASGDRGSSRLWQIPASGWGRPQPLPLVDVSSFTLSQAKNRLVYVRPAEGKHIWRLSLAESGDVIGLPTKFIASTRTEKHPQYSPDGRRILFESDRDGNHGIWVCDADGSNAVALFSQAGIFAGTPRWAPDGERVAFDSNASGNMDIWVVRSNGGKPTQLTLDPSDDHVPSWSVDGKWVYFASKRTGRFQIWKAPAYGGDAVQVTRNGGWMAFESRDGKSVYYVKLSGEAVWTVPAIGGEERIVIPALGSWAFSVFSDGIYFAETVSRMPSIRFLSFATGKTKVVAPVLSDVGGFSVSPDRRSILFGRGDAYGSDLMLVENFRP